MLGGSPRLTRGSRMLSSTRSQRGATSGSSNFSLALNGTSNGVQASSLLTTLDNVSFGGFAKTNSITQQRQAIISSGTSASNGIGIYINRDTVTFGIYILFGGVSWYNSGTAISDNNWHHVFVTRSGTAAKFYLDGSPIGGTVTVGSPLTATGSTLVGRDSSASGFFNGNLDLVQFYTTVLSAADVSSLYTTRIQPVGSTLALSYAFDEGFGTSATDGSGNANTGTITGAGYSTDVP